MRHPSYVSDPRFRHFHLNENGNHAGDSAVDDVTTETEETSVFLPFYTRSDPGCWRARWCAACPRAADDGPRQEGECVGNPGHSPPCTGHLR